MYASSSVANARSWSREIHAHRHLMMSLFWAAPRPSLPVDYSVSTLLKNLGYLPLALRRANLRRVCPRHACFPRATPNIPKLALQITSVIPDGFPTSRAVQVCDLIICLVRPSRLALYSPKPPDDRPVDYRWGPVTPSHGHFMILPCFGCASQSLAVAPSPCFVRLIVCGSSRSLQSSHWCNQA